MKQTLDQIRRLLAELEQEANNAAIPADRAIVTGLELPDIICDVVDFLLPELKPYEASLYMYLLRHSVVETGTQLLRVSRRGLQSGVVKSPYAGTRSGSGDIEVSEASYKTIRIALKGLEAVRAIRREAEPDRDGTLYRVLLPEEIEMCQRSKANRTSMSSASIIEEAREVDFYNVRENRMRVYERDNYHCRYCNKQLTRFTATLDHVQPVANGGDNSIDNLVTACLDCNSRKNVRPVGDFLAS